jgi:hypothetical protein
MSVQWRCDNPKCSVTLPRGAVRSGWLQIHQDVLQPDHSADEVQYRWDFCTWVCAIEFIGNHSDQLHEADRRMRVGP